MRRGETLASKLEDVLLDLLRGDLEPSGSRALVRESRTGLKYNSIEISAKPLLESRGEEKWLTIPLWGLCMRPILN